MDGYGEAPYGMPDMNGAYLQPMGYQETAPKKSNTGKIIGIIAGAVVVVIALIVVGALLIFGGIKKSEEIIDEFMIGMAEGNTDKMVGYMDPDCYDDSDVEYLADSFKTIEDYGMEYAVDYEIVGTEKASDSLIEEMCESLYDDADVADDVSKAYVTEVNYTATITFYGETKSDEQTIYLICYKKDGEWYLGGSAEEE